MKNDNNISSTTKQYLCHNAYHLLMSSLCCDLALDGSGTWVSAYQLSTLILASVEHFTLICEGHILITYVHA